MTVKKIKSNSFESKDAWFTTKVQLALGHTGVEPLRVHCLETKPIKSWLIGQRSKYYILKNWIYAQNNKYTKMFSES